MRQTATPPGCQLAAPYRTPISFLYLQIPFFGHHFPLSPPPHQRGSRGCLLRHWYKFKPFNHIQNIPMHGSITSYPEYLTEALCPSLCFTRALFGFIRFTHFQPSTGNRDKNIIHIIYSTNVAVNLEKQACYNQSSVTSNDSEFEFPDI